MLRRVEPSLHSFRSCDLCGKMVQHKGYMYLYFSLTYQSLRRPASKEEVCFVIFIVNSVLNLYNEVSGTKIPPHYLESNKRHTRKIYGQKSTSPPPPSSFPFRPRRRHHQCFFSGALFPTCSNTTVVGNFFCFYYSLFVAPGREQDQQVTQR